ncbi:hypothetical protein INF37_02235 [Pseudoflavonifractor sp. DSM 107456]|uniref:Uncharacterized protein n=1 Tax=Pseudoflavonifractor gallinarum TaxID=2779352 RepID=A0ABR9R802_9FIRM|nr:hypothetical protein [Pseudoflavonifractor gallinarum]MBE5054825.1 hypothetical protein [Pseudoflavonifractor gallinarum]
MNRWRALTPFPRIMLCIQAGLLLLFTALYLTLGIQRGIDFQGEFLRQVERGEDTVYTGTLDGKTVELTYTPSGALFYRWGDVEYGPYTLTEDPTALPPSETMGRVTGVELRLDGEILFRGGYGLDGFYLVNENGTKPNRLEIIANGTAYGLVGSQQTYEDGLSITRAISLLLEGPPIRSRVDGEGYFLGTLVVVINAVAILFADELFRWNLRWSIRHPERAEPSEWELFSRGFSWVVLTIVALIGYMMGLSGSA